MRREELGNLAAFLAVAEDRSFTRAAARLGTSQSSLSQAVRRLEEQLGVRLLVRNTRNIAPTEAGELLFETLRPAFDEIDTRPSALGTFREKPAGTVRITVGQHAADTIVWPAVARLLPRYPDLKIELAIDSALRDIVSERYDAGVRLGEQVARDMIAVRIGPDLRMAVIGAPSYFAGHAAPVTPHDLTQHACINLRLPSSGGLYPWEFSKEGHNLNVRVEGPFIVNNIAVNREAAMAGLGLAIVLEDQITEQLVGGTLVRVLEDWCPPFPGYHLYYPSRRQLSPAFAVVASALRFRG